MKYLYEYCPVCNGESVMSYKGFIVYKCPDCESELKPCSVCDAYTDDKMRSCNECPFERGIK